MDYIKNLPKPGYKRVVIVGGGFGGLKLSRKLLKTGYQVVLIDKNNYHQFQPLLYQVATAGLEPSAIAFPFRKIFQNHKRAHFRIAELQSIDSKNNEITTNIGKLGYDYLVIAAGLTTNFFGNQNIKMNALPMKQVSDAILIRNTILQNYEAALNQTDPIKTEAYLNIVIVGGGPTGVELAGAVAEMKKFILPKDYPELDFDLMSIHLFEGAPRLLNGFSEKSSQKAREYLEKLGVIVEVNTIVKDYDSKYVTLVDGSRHCTFNLVWAAGVKPIEIEGLDLKILNKGNRILTDEFNKIKGYENIFAIGDIAAIQTGENKNGHPQVAQVAIQQAANLGTNLKQMKAGKKLRPFVYKNKGSLATIGRNLAVAELPGFRFQGFIAWVLWSLVHVLMIIGVKNKLFILMDWSWSYFNYDHSLRLLINPRKKKNEDSSPPPGNHNPPLKETGNTLSN